jgi:hypothetical protein
MRVAYSKKFEMVSQAFFFLPWNVYQRNTKSLQTEEETEGD